MKGEYNMTEENIKKAVSIRTTKDAEELFQTIAKGFSNKDEAFRSLLASYQRESKKDDLSEHRDRIESFTANLRSAERYFLEVLESYKEVKDTAKADFIDEIDRLKVELEDKDKEVLSSRNILVEEEKELQEKAKELENVRSKADLSDTYKEQVESLKDEIKGLRKSLEEYQRKSKEDEDTLLKIDGELKAKELEASSLQGDIKVLKTKIESESKTSQGLSADIESLKEEIKAYKKAISEKDEYIKELNTKLLENKENNGM